MKAGVNKWLSKIHITSRSVRFQILTGEVFLYLSNSLRKIGKNSLVPCEQNCVCKNMIYLSNFRATKFLLWHLPDSQCCRFANMFNLERYNTLSLKVVESLLNENQTTVPFKGLKHFRKMMPFCLFQKTWHTGSPEKHFILKKDKELQSIWRAYFAGKGQYVGIKTSISWNVIISTTLLEDVLWGRI